MARQPYRARSSTAPWTRCPAAPRSQRAERVKNDPNWRYFELQTGHNLHYTAPEETVEILLKLANA